MGGSKTTTTDFRRADFGLLRTLVEGVPWERVLKGKGVQQGLTFVKEEVLKAWEQAVPMYRKTNRRGRRPAWLNNGLRLHQGRFGLDVRRNVITGRVVKHQNRLPREMGESPSREGFKKHVDGAGHGLEGMVVTG